MKEFMRKYASHFVFASLCFFCLTSAIKSYSDYELFRSHKEAIDDLQGDKAALHKSLMNHKEVIKELQGNTKTISEALKGHKQAIEDLREEVRNLRKKEAKPEVILH